MRFKIDENLPTEVAEILRDSGHDALTVKDQLLEGFPDSRIWDVCCLEDRVILTLDVGFADIRVYPTKGSPGRIVFRLARQEKTHVLAVLENVIPLLGKESLEAHLWIVEESGIRIRGGETEPD